MIVTPSRAGLGSGESVHLESLRCKDFFGEIPPDFADCNQNSRIPQAA
jgi:hypothetical protein